MIEDRQLLREFVEVRSERAFRDLVERHIPLVYHVALRQAAGNVTIAEETAQDVFVALAAKAKGLIDRESISGWLYHAARLSALNRTRREQRRIDRVQEVYPMQPTQTEALPDWRAAAPVIAQALGELTEPDRSAVLLRFYENRSFADVARALRTTEDAARMRTSRALERLGGALRRHGITSSSSALAGWLATQAVGAVPSELAGAISLSALSGPAGGAASWFGQFAAMNILKTGIASALVAAALTATLFQVRANRALSRHVAALRAETEPFPQSARERNVQRAAEIAAELHDPQTAELGRIHSEIERLNSRPPGVTDAAFKKADTWINRGCATPEAAVETLFWAAAHHDLDVLTQACYLDDRWAPLLTQWFSTLSPQVQAEFGTPNRLIASVVGPFLIDDSGGAGAGRGPVIAYQVTDRREEDSGDAVVTVWKQAGSGEEMSQLVKLGPTSAGWGYDANFRTAAQWQHFVLDQIDPNTGGWKASK